MSDQSGRPGAEEPRGGLLKWALWGVALIGVAAVVYIMAQVSTKPPPANPAAKDPAEAQDVAKLLSHEADGKPPPDYVFQDADGKPVRVADFKGKVVVMNLWATWCGPCKVEMPTLARLQTIYVGKPVVVLAISIDKPEALAEAKAFMSGQAPLAFYNDPAAKLPWVMEPAAAGMPTTVIYGRDGLERGRVSGDAEWATPAAVRLIDKVLAQG
jgi:thiol-disulfide isomerase/thioredoxin